MGYVVSCDCGHTLRSEDEDGIVAEVQMHVRSEHPEMADSLTREQALGMARQE